MTGMNYKEFAKDAFDMVNDAFYGGELEELDIYCDEYGRDADPGAFLAPVKDRDPQYEPAIIVNVSNIAKMVEDDIFGGVCEGILSVMAHEAVHYWCWLNDVEGVDEDGRHNELFRTAALAHGLVCEDRGMGWGVTGFSLTGARAIQARLDGEVPGTPGI